MSDDDQGGERRRLERAPGERYAATPGRAGATGSSGTAGSAARTRAVVSGAIVADAGALLYFALGLIDLGAGMLAVAAFTGWTTGVALVWHGRRAITPDRLRHGLAISLGAWSIVLAMALDWLYGLAQGGALGPVEYVLERYGWWGIASILVAALLAGFRAR